VNRSAPLSRPAAQVLLHLSVVLWGCTAILGRAISIDALPLVWYRLLLSIVGLAILIVMRGMSLRVSLRALGRYAIVGACIGVHWLCFFGAVKHAGIPTSVLTLSTMSFFTAITEPIAFRRRARVGELVLGAVVVVGVALLLKLEVHADPLGLALGLASALFASVFGVLNARIVHDEQPMRLMLFELCAAFVVVSLCFAVAPSELVAPWQLSGGNFMWLAVLAVACTVVPQVWSLMVLRVLSPFTIALSINLEPVYSLILAAILYSDTDPLSGRFYGGAALILVLVVVNATRNSRAQQSNTSPQDRLRMRDPS
jgi:drug/metabolite transporter (DMT)-like permease